MSDSMAKLMNGVMKKVGERSREGLQSHDDWEAEMERIFNEPPDPELLALAEKACEEQKRDDEYLASLSPEERKRVQSERIEKLAKWMVETPFYEAELLGICKAEDVR